MSKLDRIVWPALAALLLWSLAAHAAFLCDGVDDIMNADVAITTAMPVTIVGRFNPANDPANTRHIVAVNKGDAALSIAGWYLSTAGATAGNPLAAVQGEGLGTQSAISTLSLTQGTWYSGLAEFASATSRTIFVDGANSAENTTDQTPAATQNRTSICAAFANSNVVSAVNARVAEVGFYLGTLSDGEKRAIGENFSPGCVRRNLSAHYRMIADVTSLKSSISGGPTLTLAGGPTVARHPPVYRCDE